MQRPRCSAKLPNTCGWTSPTTRSGSILMRAAPAATGVVGGWAAVPAGWAPSGGGARTARKAALSHISRRCRFIDSTPSRELLRADDSRPFTNDDELVGGHAGDLFRGAAGPAHGEVRGGRGPQSEVQAAVARGVEARGRHQLLCLRALAVARDHTRADRAPDRLHGH